MCPSSSVQVLLTVDGVPGGECFLAVPSGTARHSYYASPAMLDHALAPKSAVHSQMFGLLSLNQSKVAYSVGLPGRSMMLEA